MTRPTARAAAGLAALTLGLTGLSACADEPNSGGGGGGGVDFGATQQEYEEAFGDVAPITLRTQTPAPKGSTTGLPMERYFDAVSEWSGGKITFDVAYSNSVADPAEVDDALVDGRLDVASVLPVYEPSEYPAINALIELGALSDSQVVTGDLQSNAWPNEAAFSSDEIINEFNDHAMVPLLPIYDSGSDALFCREKGTSTDDLDGVVVAAGGTATSDQVSALGASPSSIPYTELYEALQRGAVDCTVAGTTVGVLGGFVSAAPHMVIDPAAGFVTAPGSLAVSKATWESLPLVAQQLLWDRLDVFVRSNLEEKVWPNVIDAVTQAREAGGEVSEFDVTARKAVQGVNESIVEQVAASSAFADPADFVKGARESAERWKDLVEDELGVKWDYNSFAEGDVETPELGWYVDRLFGEVFEPHRPS